MRFYLIIFLLLSQPLLWAQPQPCGPTPIMANNCADACVICDINGFTGTNNLQAGAPGPEPPTFCSTPDDMHYIAFIAGSESLSIEIIVDNCIMGQCFEISLDLGFFESLDCQTFVPITECEENLSNNDSFVFNTTEPLTIGQHYYLVMDGSCGSICNWTFNVLEGTTEVSPLDSSGEIIMPDEICPEFPTVIQNSGVVGAALYFWEVNGNSVSNTSDQFSFSFPNEGTYEICVRAANVCDEGPRICDSIRVREIETLELNELLCEGDCITVNDMEFCTAGVFQEIVVLPNGCDSIINLQVEVLPQPLTNLDVWICNDQSFSIGSNTFDQTGSYSGTVLTENDCDSIVNLELLVIECEIEGTADQTAVICNGTASGILSFSIDQGTPPLSYTYTNIANTSITGTGTTDLLTNNDIVGLPAGTYQIYVQDNFNNDVVLPLIEVTEPPVMSNTFEASNFSGFNVSCNQYFDPQTQTTVDGDDGSLQAFPNGGVPPYSFVWSNQQTEQTAINLRATAYQVTITDAVGCEFIADFTLSAPPSLEPAVEFIDPNCDGFDSGNIIVSSISGGVGPYNFALNTPNQFTMDSIFEGLFEGDYSVYVQDANACIAEIAGNLTAPEIPVITNPGPLEMDLGDSISIIPGVNDIEILSILWNDNTDLSCPDCLEPVSYAVNNTAYNLVVTSTDDCSDEEIIEIKVNKIRPVYIPNIFSPNKDGVNDVFTVYTNRATEIVEELSIFDRWGNLIFEQKNFPSNDESYGWNGKFKGKELKTGVFVYYAKLKFIDNIVLPYTGSITLSK